MEFKRRFYIGADHLAEDPNHSHLKATMKEAIAHAEEKIEGGSDVEIVVEIVAIVRRKETPIEVEVIRKPSTPVVRRKASTRRRSR